MSKQYPVEMDLMVMQAIEALEEAMRDPAKVIDHVRAATDKLYAFFGTTAEEEEGVDWGYGPILLYPDGKMLRKLD